MKIIIREILESQGGGFEACVEGMEFYLIGNGDGPLEALEDLIRFIRLQAVEKMKKNDKWIL